MDLVSVYPVTDDYEEKDIKFFGWMDSTFRSFDDDISAGKIYNNRFGENSTERPLVQWNDTKRAQWWTSDGAKWVDYTNPDATEWLKERFKPYLASGLRGMMVDYNDKITVDAYYPYNEGTGDWMHNFSCYYYNQAVNEVFKEYYGEGDYINFARAGCAGSQAFTAVFAGDQTADYMGLQQVVSALLSSASSGIHIWGSDVGGMHKSSTAAEYDPELYARWLAFATFSPLMRSHAQRGFTDPWEYDSNGSSEAIFQKYYWTRENIIDLVYSGTVKARVEDYPMSQAMVIAYPEQTELANNITQYIFCDQLLVCPVTTEKVASIDVQFPEGRWVDFWDGTVYEGGQTVNVAATLEKTPVFVKEGGAFPITYGEDLNVGTVNTVGKNVNALLVAPANERVENTYYVDDTTTQTVVCDVVGEKTYSVSSDAAMDKKVVTARGALADKVVVDGKELTELTERPTSAAEKEGFYKDVENNSTIIVTSGSWSNIEYNDTELRPINYALNKTVTTEGLKEEDAKSAQNVVDGAYNTNLILNDGRKTNVTVDLESVKEINKILVAWTGNYARNYVVEISTDGEEWTEVYEKKKGGGGTDKILLDEKEECRYIRLSGFEKRGRKSPELVEVEVYGDELGNISEQQQQKSILDSLNPYIIASIGTAALLLVAVVVLLLKKKKKKNLQ